LPIELIWSPLARRRLAQIHDYVAADKPQAAARLAVRLAAVAEVLREFPHLGMAGNNSDVRELIVGGTPYVIVYRFRSRRVIILTIRHASRQP
jgi:plasmid stabilization system protein ParE